MIGNLNNSESVEAAERPLESVIASHPFLSGLKPEHARLLSQNAMRVRYQPGEVIFREGDPANRFYLIESGSVALEAHPQGANAVRVQTIGPGSVLGWSWLFPPYTWHFDARALEPTGAIFFYGTRLREYCDQDPDFGYQMMQRIAAIVIERLQETRRRFSTADAQPLYSAEN